jgi:hypothetical protein
MRRLALLVVLSSAACTDSPDDRPVEPNATPVSGTVTTGSGDQVLRGKVCMLVDPRFLDACTSADAGGLTVSAGGVTTTTASDGSFELAMPTTANLILTATGPNIVASSTSLTNLAIIPVMSSDLFAQMITSTDAMLATGTGSILATLDTATGSPAVGVTASSTPTGAFGPFFDGTSATSFGITGTGQRGVTWFAGVPAGATSLTFTNPAGGESTVEGIQVIDGGMTFVDSVLP